MGTALKISPSGLISLSNLNHIPCLFLDYQELEIMEHLNFRLNLESSTAVCPWLSEGSSSQDP